jgi:hypothetical protein
VWAEAGVTGDQEVVGKIGRVTGTIGPRTVGEVMIPSRGGSEAYNAHASDAEQTIETAARVLVVEYYPPRTVVVEKL